MLLYDVMHLLYISYQQNAYQFVKNNNEKYTIVWIGLIAVELQSWWCIPPRLKNQISTDEWAINQTKNHETNGRLSRNHIGKGMINGAQ